MVEIKVLEKQYNDLIGDMIEFVRARLDCINQQISKLRR